MLATGSRRSGALLRRACLPIGLARLRAVGGVRLASADAEGASTTSAPLRPHVAVAAGGALSLSEQTGVYLELAKYRLSALVVFTTSAGYAMAGPPFDLTVLAPALAGTFLASASASCLNQLFEIDRDARMRRTMRRPLPSGRVSVPHALAFATCTGVAGVGMLGVCVNPLTAALGLANIVLYAGVYTPLKVRSYHNTVVGAIVGALPPLMGWSAATGSICGLEPLALGATLFLWQMPHFYALAWLHRADYSAGGYKMLPLYDPTGERTAAHCMGYALALSVVPFATSAAGVTSGMFAVESLAFNGALLVLARRFQERSSQGRARALFLYSLMQLPVMLALLVFHGERLQHAPSGAERADRPPAPAESALAGSMEMIARLRGAGRELCVHEFVKAAPASGVPAACPVVLREASASESALKSLAVGEEARDHAAA